MQSSTGFRNGSSVKVNADPRIAVSELSSVIFPISLNPMSLDDANPQPSQGRPGSIAKAGKKHPHQRALERSDARLWLRTSHLQ